MKTEIIARIVPADEGYFIGRAVGFRGVWATGSTIQEVAERITTAWIAMYGEEVLHTSSQPVSSLKSTEHKIALQAPATA